MDDGNSLTLFATAAFFGVVAHQILFKRVEVDTHPLIIFVSFLGAPTLVSCLLRSYSTRYVENATSMGVFLVGCFLLSLWISILVYRILFHPLKKFPGPFNAKISKIWALKQAAKTNLKWYQVDSDLHQKYGDYVRTGKILHIRCFSCSNCS